MTRATVRTYRHGLGDCHLVTLRGDNGASYTILIDCGVILGTEDAKAKMTRVMDDIGNATDGKIDLLVATHEHWDHLSGFLQAGASFGRLRIGEVWMGWTEDPDDEQARQLQRERGNAVDALRETARGLQAAGDADTGLVASLLEFFGAAGRATTKQALEAVRARAKPHYCDPTKDAPREIADVGARIYVLGPPRSMEKLRKINPSAKGDEAYRVAADKFRMAFGSGAADSDDLQPFSSLYRIPLGHAKTMPFFLTTYWDGEAWRRIDSAWAEGATQFALALDSMTNNTSLVLAIELDGGEVLLFPADAQIGSWLSWGDCNWDVNGRTVTGSDLLKRTVLYKVGHHGSINATLKANGLALMQGLEHAVIPVDHDVALKKRWGALPLEGLVTELERSTSGRGWVLRTDRPLPPGVDPARVRSTDLFIEIDV